MEEVFKATMPNEMGFAYMGMSLPGKAGAGRCLARSDFCLLAALRFPRSRCAIRKLDFAFQRPAEFADRGLGRVRRAVGRDTTR